MTRFGAQAPNGTAVQELEVLVRTAIFKPANALVGVLLQQAADISASRSRWLAEHHAGGE